MGRKAVVYLFRYLAIAFTALLLAAAVLSWRASFIPPSEQTVWGVLALLMPAILAANAAALAVWLFRREWIMALLPVAALLLNMGYIASMVQLLHIGDGDRRYDLRVATLNVNGFRWLGERAYTAHEISDMAVREQIDVLCMQEFLDDHIVTADSIGRLFVRRFPYFVQASGQAILSRFPIVGHRYRQFPDTSNDYLWADLDVDGDTVRIFSVHLQTSGISSLRHRFRKDYDRNIPVERMFGELERNSRVRVGQVDEIRAQIDSTRYPVIVTGDFNDTPSSYTYRRMKGDMTDGFRAVGSGYGGTFRYMGGLLRIDYIFYDDSFRGVRYRKLHDQVSDHRAVTADLRLER